MRVDTSKLYLFTILLALYTTSKSHASKEFGSWSSDSETDIGRDDTVNIHESYRPRHKYKTGTDQFSKRFVGSKNEMQNSKGLECAVMYKNNEPIGILQPYEESYRFLPVNGEPTLVDINPLPTKRKSIMDFLYPSEVEEDYYEDGVGFSDERYPSVFAKFKIDSRLDRSLSPKTNSSKRAKKKRESSDDELVSINDEVEEELRNILGDIGLVDDYPNQDNKRKVEDENLELGTNKIDIAKETREKRNDLNSAFPVERGSTNVTKSNVGGVEPLLSLNEKENQADSDVEDHRDKRSEEATVDHVKDDMPVLEYNTEKIEENTNIDDYGKRVEREIRDKIHKLKEEVKKEIEELRKANAIEKEDSEKKEKQTLNDDENSDIDPIVSDSGNDDIHIRRKRNIQYHRSEEDNEDITVLESNQMPRDNERNYQSRSLKEANVDYDTNEEYEDNNVMMRQPSMENENDYSANEYEPKFMEKNHIIEDSENEDSGDIGNHFTSNEKSGCNCDKNSGDCKCVNGHSKSQDLTSDEEHLMSSAKHHCDCSKTDKDCKCGNTFADFKRLPPQEISEYDDDAEIHRKFSTEKKNVLRRLHEIIKNREDPGYKSRENGQFRRAIKATKREIKEPFENGEYFVDLQPSIFKLSSSENSQNSMTSQRWPVKRHLATVRQLKMFPHSRFRRRVQKDENNREPRQLIDMSEEDIFGALPQSYEGELARYKRVKRAKKK
ncbi:uncharacterized protein [Leptinotarsa decemlineata]|uniref:uncharacterized protein n=1 Tax=Leptinotarsa decemlineata TaxID=7539 RepID=UPI003D30C8F6